MLIALGVVLVTIAYMVIGTLMALLVNGIRHKLNPTGYQDEDMLRLVFILWPVVFPFMMLMNAWVIAKYFVDKQDERFRAKRANQLTYEESIKRIGQLEKELAEALLVKEIK